eukprot:3445210-Amphidinium_carterae.1
MASAAVALTCCRVPDTVTWHLSSKSFYCSACHAMAQRVHSLVTVPSALLQLFHIHVGPA